MANTKDFEPTDILEHRYQKPQVLIEYVKTLSDKFTDNDITVKVLRDGRLGLRLSRKLEPDEIQGALKAFEAAERARQRDDKD